MPKLVYLYTTGGADGNLEIPYTDTYMHAPTTNRYAVAAETDGMVKLFSTIPMHHPNISFTHILIDSAYENGTNLLNNSCALSVVPSIRYALEIIKPGDTVVVRGGFRNWLPTLQILTTRNQNWVLFYRANTNHGHWPHWHITLDDLLSSPLLTRYGVRIPFNKPVNEDIFGYIDAESTIPDEYEFMIGASHIHRKKGQFLAIEALRAYLSMHGPDAMPASILTGGFIRDMHNQQIIQATRSPELRIHYAGSLDRRKLCLAMNRSKFFIHAGAGGQNDRGSLEAMACGCAVALANPKSAAPFLREYGFTIPSTDPQRFAEYLDGLRQCQTFRRSISATYLACNGMRQKSIPQINALIDLLLQHPEPSTALIQEKYQCLYS